MAENTAPRPLWVFLTELGLAVLLIKELKFRKVFAQKTRARKFNLRNYDMLAVPDSQVLSDPKASRLTLHALTCPVFGRYKITDGQLNALAKAWRREKADGFVSSVSGKAFQRQDLMRWTSKRLAERGVDTHLDENPEHPAWLIAVEEAYYFYFPSYTHPQARGGEIEAGRVAALPPAVAAAMIFAAQPGPGEIVWDMMAGNGALLREAIACMPTGEFFGTESDGDELKLAGKALRKAGAVKLIQGDAATMALPRRDISLALGYFPPARQSGKPGHGAATYAAILRNALTHAARNWRACFLTGDSEALRFALREVGGLTMTAAAELKLRSGAATIWIINRI